MASLALSPTGNHVAVWEGPLEVRRTRLLCDDRESQAVEQYKLYVLSLAGDLLGTFCPDPDRGFGVRAVTWHPSGAFLAVAGWDDKVSGVCQAPDAH